MRLLDSSGSLNYIVPISNGILTAEHCEHLGGMTPLFLYAIYIDRTTSERSLPGGVGKVGLVSHGRPLPDAEIAREFAQPQSRVRRCRRVLARHGYIRQKYTPAGQIIFVNKSKKWGWGSGRQLPDNSYSTKDISSSRENRAAATLIDLEPWKAIGLPHPIGDPEIRAAWERSYAQRNGHSLISTLEQFLDGLENEGKRIPAPLAKAIASLREAETSSGLPSAAPGSTAIDDQTAAAMGVVR